MENNQKPDNPSAFSRPYSEPGENWGSALHAQDGMTLRDYFAAKAVQSIIAYCSIRTTDGDMNDASGVETAASLSYKIADAMLRERSKNEE